MKVGEFSDMFDTLLNSYANKAQFGEEAAKTEIVLDEYEKSVLLTQAQDIIVKSYFEATGNSMGQGFDDSTRRQVDFSSLIKVAELDPVASNPTKFDDRGIIYQLPLRVNSNNVEVEGTTDVLFILNEKLVSESSVAYWHRRYYDDTSSQWVEDTVNGSHDDTTAMTLDKKSGGKCTSVADAEADGWVWYDGVSKNYVIVPINYKEYDREMSKPYANPLKKQAWRLFQNSSTGYDIFSELIPRFNTNTSSLIYKIRYVRRPQPIVLEDLPGELTIDGENSKTECELNPILHMDILNKAVELAMTTRGVARRAES